jgi:hypothetical protein
MSTAQYLIHIGLPKTATTNIQLFFTQNRELLLEQGVLYPRDITFSDAPDQLHRALGAALEPESTAWLEGLRQNIGGRDVVAMLHDEVARTKAEKVVISSEALCSMRDPSLLKKVVGDAKILITLRRQDELFTSLYNQSVKDRLQQNSFDGFMAVSQKNNPQMYDHDLLLSRWAGVFGEENIIPSVFSDHALPHGIIEGLAASIGFSLAGLSLPQADTNPALAAELVELKRQVNMLLPDDEVSRLKALRFFEELNKQAVAGWSPPSEENIKANLLKRNEILLRFRASNEAVCARYFPGRSQLYITPGEGDAILPGLIPVQEVTEKAQSIAAQLTGKSLEN